MGEFEKPAAFYLGKRYDIQKKQVIEEPILYDARDLTTHAVCIGMTGSGKTGLCIDLLEEAALDGVPSILIDPKGDITNMLLTFPQLRPQDFLPWINPDDARRKGMTEEAFAERTAKQWADGLAQWGEQPDRIRRLRDAAEFVIYTPGSTAGVPVSIIQTLKAPETAWSDDPEASLERVQGTVSALLGLAGIEADPVRSREHILLSSIFQHYWHQGKDLDLASLILAVQEPPVRKLGVFDVDAFLPPKERAGLAMSLNNIIAAPSFQSWIEGAPLDIGQVLRAPSGKPRVAIFYIAHLADAERMFFVTLLLSQVLDWVRGQSGTTSLRAILYIDEVFGYMPPVANPPSKQPLLTLLKQARAFGLGVMLTTQNPVDLDYKGLSNAGTWFIGKLQTERDKARLLEGLESAAPTAGTTTDRAHLDKLISSLDSRVFVLHNVHQPPPVVFTTRWAMSYLRGPLTKPQVKQLMDPMRAQVLASSPVVSAKPSLEAVASKPATLAEGVAQYYLPVRVSEEEALQREETRRGQRLSVRTTELMYEAALLAQASVRYASRSPLVDMQQTLCRVLSAPRPGDFPRWDLAVACDAEWTDMTMPPRAPASFGDIPSALNEARELKALRDSFVAYLVGDSRLTLYRNSGLKLFSNAGEPERDFRTRCQDAAREGIKADSAKVRARYATRFRALEEKARREGIELAQDRAEYEARKREELLSAGESVLTFVLGRRRPGRALSTASRRRRMTGRAQSDIVESERAIEQYKRDLALLQAQQDQEIAAVQQGWASKAAAIEEVKIAPTKAGIQIGRFGLVWRPRWRVVGADASGAPVELVLPADS